MNTNHKLYEDDRFKTAVIDGCVVREGDRLVWILADGSHLCVEFMGFASLGDKLFCKWTENGKDYLKLVDKRELRASISNRIADGDVSL